ncbi:MAG: STAS domain-containing protein [Acidimicrobiia bacterium]|nr:STAS domain-containing protein [Acidimicrobiia bacterium]
MSTHPGTLLQVVAEECDGPTVLGLSGELDMGTAPDLLAVAHDVLGRGGSDIVLDLSELAFIDSTGLSTLLMLSRKVTGLGGTLALRSPSTRVEEVLRVTGLSGYFGLG